MSSPNKKRIQTNAPMISSKSVVSLSSEPSSRVDSLSHHSSPARMTSSSRAISTTKMSVMVGQSGKGSSGMTRFRLGGRRQQAVKSSSPTPRITSARPTRPARMRPSVVSYAPPWAA